MAMGLTWPLLALRLEGQGVGGTLLGLNTMAQSFAVLVISPFAPRILGGIGIARTVGAGIVMIVAALLLLPTFDDVYAWFPIRLLLGAGATLVFIAGETWVIHAADPSYRGRVVGVLGLLWGGGFATGPLIMTVTGIAGWLPFLVGTGVVVAGGLPVLFSGGPRIGSTEGRRPRLLPLLGVAPVVLLAAVMDGFVNTINDAFLAIVGLHLGLSQTSAVANLSLLLVGVTAIQIPFGLLADRVDRRRLLSLVVVVALAATLLIPFVILRPPLLWPTLLVLGAAVGGLWAIGLILVGDEFAPADLAAANTLRGVMWGLGSVAGPLCAGVAIDLWDPYGVIAVLAAAWLLFLPLTLWRH